MTASTVITRPADVGGDPVLDSARTSPRFSAWWLAIGLLCSSATAWRLPGASVGAGEVALLAWLAYEWNRRRMAGVLSWRRPHARALSPDTVALLWTLGALAASQLYANATGYLSWGAQRDFVAVLFAGGLAFTLVTLPDRETFSRSVIIGFFWSAAVSSSLLTVYATLPQFMGLPPLVFNPAFGSRFMGLAANPNQFALLILTLPACVALAWMTYRGRARLLALAVGCFGLMGGLATQSDALMLAWVILSVCAVGAAAYWRWTSAPVAVGPALAIAGSVLLAFIAWPQVQKLKAVTVSVEAPPPVEAAGTPAPAPTQTEVVTTYAKVVEEERRTNPQQVNQVDTRVRLYTNGLRAWTDRPLLGHGVQLVSGLTAPYEKNEAHNSIIDWLTFAGVLGTIPLVIWSLLLVAYAWRRRNFIGLGALIVFGIFAQFGLIVRHPLFWVVACAFASLPSQLERPAGSR